MVRFNSRRFHQQQQQQQQQQHYKKSSSSSMSRFSAFAILLISLVVFVLFRSSTLTNSVWTSRNSLLKLPPVLVDNISSFGISNTSSGSNDDDNDDQLLENSTSESSKSKIAFILTSDENEDPEVDDYDDEDLTNNNERDHSTASNDDDDDDDDFKLSTTTKTERNIRSENNNDDEIYWEDDLKPEIVWLASYPNSGTSYTMTLVEKASDLSTASNYGTEVTYKREDSIPIYTNHIEGPYWDGLSGKLGKVRQLPTKKILTKTHCGGRCIKCNADEYVVNVHDFMLACQRTTGYKNNERIENIVPASAITGGIIHLVRNPFHNIVARFHLERRNMIMKQSNLAISYPSNATGFIKWCTHLDHTYNDADKKVHDSITLQLMNNVPCYAEFYKYAQWHNRVIEMIPYLGRKQQGQKQSEQTVVIPSLTIHYEDYAYKFNETTDKIFKFMEQDVVDELREFRNLPTYEDHFTKQHRTDAATLLKHVSTTETWELIQRYLINDKNIVSEEQQ